MAPEPVFYARGDGGQPSEAVSDRSHLESEDYQAAMYALAIPHLSAEEEADIAGSTETEPEWMQSSDGHWYLKQDDGSYDRTPHTKQEDGTFKPYTT